MWSPDIAPVFSFERHARKHGLQRARERWRQLEEENRAAEHRAHQHELEMARQAEKAGPHLINENLGGAIQYQISAHTYWQLHRASLHKRGAVGGELLNDADYMRFFLKRNPECARKSISGKIQRGWTPHDFALEKAAAEGKLAKRVPIMSAMARIEAAAQEGKAQHGGLHLS